MRGRSNDRQADHVEAEVPIGITHLPVLRNQAFVRFAIFVCFVLFVRGHSMARVRVAVA